MSSEKEKRPTYVDETITADYILKLYDESKKITNQKEKKAFLRDVKKLIPYIGQSVTIEL